MAIEQTAVIGRYLIWSTVISMNVMSWVLPMVFPKAHVALMAVIFPGYVTQLEVLQQSALADNSHRLVGGVLLILGALQFEKELRLSRPNVHRISGYLYIFLGAFAAVTGIVLVLKHGFGGFLHQAMIILIAGMYLGMLAKAYIHARNRNFIAHREWMIRGFGLVLFISTTRAIIVAMTAVGSLGASPQEIFNTAFFMSVIINLAISEWWIYQTRVGGKSSIASATVPQ